MEQKINILDLRTRKHLPTGPAPFSASMRQVERTPGWLSKCRGILVR